MRGARISLYLLTIILIVLWVVFSQPYIWNKPYNWSMYSEVPWYAWVCCIGAIVSYIMVRFMDD